METSPVGIRKLGSAALDLFFPPRCLTCRGWKGPFVESVLCQKCFFDSFQPHRVFLQRENAIPGGAIFAAGYFENKTKELITRAKFHNDPLPLSPLQRSLVQIFDRFDLHETNLITSVPSDKTRSRKRGIALPEFLARGMARRKNLPYQGQAIWRKRAVKSQTELPQKKREKNLHGVFTVDFSAVERKNVLVVDDVITTGTTAFEVMQAILAAGAEKVFFLACAETPLKDSPIKNDAPKI